MSDHMRYEPDHHDQGLQYFQQVGQYRREHDMGRYAKDSGGGDFQQAPTGNHVARCVRLVDLGTQHGTYEGKATTRNQVLLSWELCNELMNDGQPFIISEFYTNSLSEKSKLRPHLESWRGRPFSEEELNGFDLENILSKPCMLSIVANEKGRSKVAAVAQMPKGIKAPEALNVPISFWIDEWDQQAFDAMSDGIKKIIAESDEYKARKNGNGAKPQQSNSSLADMESDVPFANPYKGRLSYVV